MKKKLTGLTRMEKRKMYGGDKSIMYEKIGLVEESDVEKYRRKLGIAKGVDLLNTDMDDVDDLVTEASNAQKNAVAGTKGHASKHKGRQLRNKQFEQDEFKKILEKFKEEQTKRENMTEDEQAKYDQER